MITISESNEEMHNQNHSQHLRKHHAFTGLSLSLSLNIQVQKKPVINALKRNLDVKHIWKMRNMHHICLLNRWYKSIQNHRSLAHGVLNYTLSLVSKRVPNGVYAFRWWNQEISYAYNIHMKIWTFLLD